MRSPGSLVPNQPVLEAPAATTAFQAIIDHPGTSIMGAEAQGQIVSMATLHLLPNVTYGGRPYGLIENVVTLPAHRGRGFGAAVMHALLDRAWAAEAYKVMLLTGKTYGARDFNEKLGFEADDKFGMTLRRAPPRF